MRFSTDTADGSLALSGEPFPSQEPFPVRAKLGEGGRTQSGSNPVCVGVSEERWISLEAVANVLISPEYQEQTAFMEWNDLNSSSV